MVEYNDEKDSTKKSRRQNKAYPVERTNPELIFGIVGPIGVNLESVLASLRAALTEMRYHPILIHLTSIMQNNRVTTVIDSTSYYNTKSH
jgi:hypothetical protein